MDNYVVLKMIILSAIITSGLRLLPLLVKIPENNKFINKFFEALPYSVLTLLVFPGIFYSGGTRGFDYLKVAIGIIIVMIMSLKKYSLGIIVVVSLVIIFLFDILGYYTFNVF